MVDPLTSELPTDRTRIRRIPEKAVTDRSALNALLDECLVAHVGLSPTDASPPVPVVVPVAYARDNDRLLLHGSTASRLFNDLAGGGAVCVTVTALDGLVIARSAFESSMHYRSAMLFGTCSVLTGDEHLAALRVLTEHLIPGRWDEVRAPLDKELRATSVVEFPIAEWSLKVSDAEPDDPASDVAGDAWAGVLPLATTFTTAIAATNLRSGIPLPPSVATMEGSALRRGKQ